MEVIDLIDDDGGPKKKRRLLDREEQYQPQGLDPREEELKLDLHTLLDWKPHHEDVAVYIPSQWWVKPWREEDKKSPRRRNGILYARY